ncbi:MAG: SDR family oxidoreductase, partial [Phototrophicaceae bacterium]
AIITAASRGMGAAIARELAATGYKVALMSTSGDADKVAKELGGIAVTGSVLNTDDLQMLVDKTMETYGRVDAVVNNTGHPPKGDLLAISDESWHIGMDMVLMNVIRMARIVTPIMEKQSSGALVNISTFAAFEPNDSFPVSATLRAALASFTKIYADTYAAKGIRMNNILPGFIDSYPEREEIIAQIPTGRFGTVAEVAKTTAFLLSDGAGYITGQNIRVDGGITHSV